MATRHLSSTSAAWAALLVLGGCGSTPTARVRDAGDAIAAAPLGQSYVLIPLPSDDDTLLGRIVESPPEPGRSLDQVSRPNPCAEKLSPKATSPSANSFEDAQELAAGATASAILGVYGFQADASQASHFVYKLQTSKQASQRDTTEYVECCKTRGCGIGYVSALVYGEGEYSTAQETNTRANLKIAVASAGGTVNLKTLHKRSVKGWMAALVTVTDRNA